jgi:hypothetical protein
MRDKLYVQFQYMGAAAAGDSASVAADISARGHIQAVALGSLLLIANSADRQLHTIIRHACTSPPPSRHFSFSTSILDSLRRPPLDSSPHRRFLDPAYPAGYTAIRSKLHEYKDRPRGRDSLTNRKLSILKSTAALALIIKS